RALAEGPFVFRPPRALVELVIIGGITFAATAPAPLPSSAHLRPRLDRRERGHPRGELLGDLAQEARRRVEAQFAEQRAAARQRQNELLARARHAHVAEAPLLGHLVRVLFAAAGPGLPERARVREDALLESGEPDRIELQPLRRMQ